MLDSLMISKTPWIESLYAKGILNLILGVCLQ